MGQLTAKLAQGADVIEQRINELVPCFAGPLEPPEQPLVRSSTNLPLIRPGAAAQRTRHLRFRVALHTLPLTNPMRLAGEIAAADIICGGRLETGLGRGHAWLYPGSGADLAESRERFDEAVEILIRAWTEEAMRARHQRFYPCDNANEFYVVEVP